MQPDIMLVGINDGPENTAESTLASAETTTETASTILSTASVVGHGRHPVAIVTVPRANTAVNDGPKNTAESTLASAKTTTETASTILSTASVVGHGRHPVAIVTVPRANTAVFVFILIINVLFGSLGGGGGIGIGGRGNNGGSNYGSGGSHGGSNYGSGGSHGGSSYGGSGGSGVVDEYRK
ncbi:hypothetical protein MAR_003615 [Mya arenaria]|uniref:Uncharacterized protein n=1 Tax=Mya arenaria TaxID=6604 RepID=A0ABY7G7Z2_MYAAR|nr:hypothetical protein MAR_003615 [Mya arenaria]